MITASHNDARELARRIRAHALRMVHGANASHIGSCLSMADLLAVLYSRVLRVAPSQPDWPDRDRFILSKGHGAAILYVVLAERGFFPREWLDTYCQDGSKLAGHITHHGVPGVEASTGSLGHGLSIGCGMALAGKREGQPYQVFVVLSDRKYVSRGTPALVSVIPIACNRSLIVLGVQLCFSATSVRFLLDK